jgi:hypothetical protein
LGQERIHQALEIRDPPDQPGSHGLGNTWDPPESFHQVQREEMFVLKWVQIAEVGGGSYYDFAGYAFHSLPLELSYRRTWQLHFGYRIDHFGTHAQKIYASSLSTTDDDGKTFVQNFDEYIKVVVTCDQTVAEDVDREPNVTIRLALVRPKKQKYYR